MFQQLTPVADNSNWRWREKQDATLKKRKFPQHEYLFTKKLNKLAKAPCRMTNLLKKNHTNELKNKNFSSKAQGQLNCLSPDEKKK